MYVQTMLTRKLLCLILAIFCAGFVPSIPQLGGDTKAQADWDEGDDDDDDDDDDGDDDDD